MQESDLFSQLGQRKQQQSELVDTVNKHYGDYVFNSVGAVTTSESVYFPIKEGVLAGYWLDTDAADYQSLEGKTLSSIQDLYFFVFTPQQMQELILDGDEEEE
ncbi:MULTISPECIES: hypothetical protein [unclassified Pseudoalteromonas]|uniref:hypothetical protein n=1 Tax=unclassified Pseudoalteromonas TaxID=194690 RepID=UPI000CF66C09|nr:MULTISPECIES: hypothetical protein [unclassified Pseudoalteromonas]MBS3796147.1 hypothetical protein [Pseudoalteromonas sp. BDTF-M6]